MGFKSNLPAFLKKFQGDLDDALETAGNEAVEIIKRDTPVDTGALRESVHVETDFFGNQRIVVGDEDVDYAIYVHNGTSRRVGDPFVTRNLSTIGSRYFNALVSKLRF